MPRRAMFLVNRKARAGSDDCGPLRQRLIAGGVELLETMKADEDPADVIRRDGPAVDLIVLGGGDGTIHHALPALLDVQRPVGLLPLGTANDLVRTLAIPLDPLAACDVILAGREQRIDVGQVDERPFVNVASLGLAVNVTRRLTGGAKSRWGLLAYVWAALCAFVRSRSFTVEICCDGTCTRMRTWQIAVGNGRSYGGGLTIHEDARIDDGRLDVYSLELRRAWHLLGLIPALWRGRLDPQPNVRTWRAKEVELRSIGRPRSITADGELIGQTPVVFRVRPQALTVFAPAETSSPAGTAGF